MRMLALCVAAVVAGCAGGSGSGVGGLPATFTRSGGFAGFDDTLVVAADGSMTLTDKTKAVKKGNASAAEVARLKELLENPAFKGLQPSYATGGGADRMSYTISSAGKTVTTMDGSPHPPVLAEAIVEFSRLIGEVR